MEIGEYFKWAINYCIQGSMQKKTERQLILV